MSLYNDTFTESVQTNLAAHTADSGQTYTDNSAANNFQISAAGRLFYNASGSGLALVNGFTSDSEFDLDTTFYNVNSAGSPMGIIFCYSDASNFYYIRYSSGSVVLYSVVAGAFNQIGTFATSFNLGTSLACKAKIRSGTLNVDVGTTTDAISTTNTDHARAGSLGYRGYNDSTGGYQIDSVTYTAVAGVGLSSNDASITEGSPFNAVITGLTTVPVSATITGGKVSLTVTALSFNSSTNTVSFTGPALPNGNSYTVSYTLAAADLGGTITTGAVTSTNTFPYTYTPTIVDSNSILHGQNLGTDVVELKIITDADPSLLSINWAQMNTDQTWAGDLSYYATPVAGKTGTTNVTVGVLFSDAAEGSFTATIVVNSTGTVVIVSGKLIYSLIPSLIPNIY